MITALNNFRLPVSSGALMETPLSLDLLEILALLFCAFSERVHRRKFDQRLSDLSLFL